MDKIFEIGTSKIFSQVALKAAKLFGVMGRYTHYDTTSVSVWGQYEEADDDAINITYGHSKDHRPDLKQFMVECLCVERNIAIMGRCVDGNSSDKTLNNKLLTQLTQIMAQHGLEPGAFIHVADSALVTESNLEEMGENLFITRLPFNYSEAARVVTQAVARDQWTPVGAIAISKPTPNRPVAEYRVCETPITLYGKAYRAIVVHSSAHDKRRLKRVERELAEERKRLEALVADAVKVDYFCEADARAACRRLEQEAGKLYRLNTEVVERPQYARGRPKKNEPRTISQMRYGLAARIEENKQAVEKKREEAGCFVLLTNAPIDGEMGHSGEQALRAYKDQNGVERNFAFLKDPMIVNDLFLKNPARVEALGMILLISLLIWNLIERSLRRYVEEGGKTLPGWLRRQTTRPTTFMMTTKFNGITIVRMGGKIALSRPLNQTQEIYLKALSIDMQELLGLPNPRAG